MTTVFFLLILTFCIYSEHTIVLTVFLWLPIHSNESKVLLTNSSIGRHVPNRCVKDKALILTSVLLLLAILPCVLLIS